MAILTSASPTAPWSPSPPAIARRASSASTNATCAPSPTARRPGFGGWDEEREVESVRERMAALKRASVDTILGMTVGGLGRDPALVAPGDRGHRAQRAAMAVLTDDH
jgi:hypothetical protein